MIPIPLPLIGYCVAAFVGVGAVTYAKHVYDDRIDLQHRVATQEESMRLLKRSGAADVAALTGRLSDTTRIVTVTKEILVHEPSRLPPGTADLPGGFRVRHDAAAAGVSPSASGADGAAVPAQAASDTVVENYGTCLDNASRLERLQQWLKDQIGSPKP